LADRRRDNGDTLEPYTRFPNHVLEALIALDRPASDHRIACAIVRLTYGWGKPTGDSISTRQLAELTRLSRWTVKRRLNVLVRDGIVTRRGTERHVAVLSIQPDVTRWECSRGSRPSDIYVPGSVAQEVFSGDRAVSPVAVAVCVPSGDRAMSPQLVAPQTPSGDKALSPTKETLPKKQRKQLSKGLAVSGEDLLDGQNNTETIRGTRRERIAAIKGWWTCDGLHRWRPADEAACAQLLSNGIPPGFITREGDAFLVERPEAADGKPIQYFKYLAGVIEDRWRQQAHDEEWVEIEKTLPNPSQAAGFQYLREYGVPERFWPRAVARHKGAYRGQESVVQELFDKWVAAGSQGYARHRVAPVHGGNGEGNAQPE
jgi:phage replication O-like protein O